MNEQRKTKVPKTLRFRHFLARLMEFESLTFRLGDTDGNDNGIPP